MELGEVNQSNIALKKDGPIKFEPTKIANTFKDLYSVSRNVVRKFPVAPTNSTIIRQGSITRV